MLLTTASWNQQDCPFVIDSTSLVLKVTSYAIKDMDSLHSPEFMPLNHLAYLAEECESIVFGVQLKDLYSIDNGVSGKILGLICLSQLHSDWPTTNTASMKLSNGADASLVVATMTALNLLESSIRSLVIDCEEVDNKEITNKKGAPLLRDMIESLSKLELKSDAFNRDVIEFKTLATILRALLLPTRLCGINLRNLVSHGFISTIGRRWFALVVVLIQTLDHYACATNGVTRTLNGSNNLMKYKPMTRVVSHGQQLLLGDRDRLLTQLSRSFVPPTHLHLTQFIFGTLAKSIQQSLQPKEGVKLAELTTIFLIASSSLLEHSLRLHWCRANNKPDERIARPSRYYVTLDGHGQRDKHDTVISPYLRDGSTNQLINEIDSSASLLQDLFSAPSVEAPNIRSQLCHGALDAEVIQELELLAYLTLKTDLDSQTGSTISKVQTKKAFLTDAACAITTTMDLISSSLSGKPKLMSYEPIYSYAATWRRDLKVGIENLAVLNQHVSNDLIVACINEMQLQLKESSVISYELEAFGVNLNLLQGLQQDYFSCHLATSGAETIWLDYHFNVSLSECIAAQTLLNEVSDAAKRYLEYVERAIDVLGRQPTSTKEKRGLKTTKRMCGIASITLNFYALAIYVSLITVQNAILIRGTEENKSPTRSDCIRAVERTRMTLSTFDGYMEKNIDRSLRAISQYLAGKALRTILLGKS
eukprot:scaffold4540_cov66-Cyclotella_meneghiniana.AAC.2